MDVMNAQPGKQYAADAIRKNTTACNIVLKWCTVLPQTLAWIQHPYVDVMRGGQSSSWTVEISLNNHPILFKLDTGAEVTACSV